MYTVNKKFDSDVGFTNKNYMNYVKR